MPLSSLLLIPILAGLAVFTSITLISALSSSTASTPSSSTSASNLISPVPSSSSFHFSYGSCNKESSSQPLWNSIVSSNPELFVWLGDVIYADRFVPFLPFLRWPASAEVIKQRYDEQLSNKNYTLLTNKIKKNEIKMIGIWDDHDYGVNDGGAEYYNKKVTSQLFLDFIGEPTDSPRRKQEGIYTSYTQISKSGHRIKFILLDLRYFQNIRNDIMIGEVQSKWLLSELFPSEKDSFDFVIIASSIQLVDRQKWIGEGWRTTPKSRTWILETFYRFQRQNPKIPLLILSGDVHFSEIQNTFICRDEKDNNEQIKNSGYVAPIWEHTSSGMTHSQSTQAGRFVSPKRLNSILSYLFNRPSNEFFLDLNYGDIYIDFINQRILILTKTVNGEIGMQYDLTFDELRLTKLPENLKNFEDKKSIFSAPAPKGIERKFSWKEIEEKCAKEWNQRNQPFFVMGGPKLAGVLVGLLAISIAVGIWIIRNIAMKINEKRRNGQSEKISSKKKQ